MNKRHYIKPEINMVSLSTEERMAACDYTWIVNMSGQSCYTNIWAISNPGSCLVATTPHAGS